MNVLVFANTPAHAHLYKHLVSRLDSENHDVLVLAREYGCTVSLLEYYDLPYETYGSCETTMGSLFRELPRHFLGITRKARRFDPDLIFGVGTYAAYAGAITDTPVVCVLDSEPTGLDHALSKPFVGAFLTPKAFRKDLGEKQISFPGFKESAYLHPAVSDPDSDVRSDLGVSEDERFAIVRFNAFGSHHDVGHAGFTSEERREILQRLAETVTVFVSDEGDDLDVRTIEGANPIRPFDLHPARLHDALAEANLLVADTQTMVTEAALLGTPAIRSNSFVGDDDMGNFKDLEEAGLVVNLESVDDVLDHCDRFLERDTDELTREWEEKRDAYVDGMVDLTEVLCRTVETAGRVFVNDSASARPTTDSGTERRPESGPHSGDRPTETVDSPRTKRNGAREARTADRQSRRNGDAPDPSEVSV